MIVASRSRSRHHGPIMAPGKAPNASCPKAFSLKIERSRRADHLRTLLAWYDQHRRELPWRADPGRIPDPYHVWLSEMMLQQTTVAATIPYFRRFLERWPDIFALADASLEEVLVAWQGLGYYRRAHHLHRAARWIVEAEGGRFPGDEVALRALPGVGAYTAAAMGAIVFNQPTVVVDGNVERVLARLFAVERPLPEARAELHALAAALAPKEPAERPGDYAQAMMDLGATLCRPRNPDCSRCPLQGGCAAGASANPALWPKRRPRPPRPTRHAIAWFARDPKGRILLRRRPPEGLLGGMMEVPSTEWQETPPDLADAPFAADWRLVGPPVVHVFTHFRLEIRLARASLPASARARFGDSACWIAPDALHLQALPSVMRKLCRQGLAPRL